MNIQTKSTITFPKCLFQKEETMPEASCRFFYECESCKAVLRTCAKVTKPAKRESPFQARKCEDSACEGWGCAIEGNLITM